MTELSGYIDPNRVLTAEQTRRFDQLPVELARELTDQIKTGVEAVWHLITRAYTERAWSALGYSSWDDYCTREFGTSRLRLPREERTEVVSSLRESGLSLRAIASATGLDRKTVRGDLAEVGEKGPPADPEPVVDAVPEPECDGKCATDECVCPADDEGENTVVIVPEQHLPPEPENYTTWPEPARAPAPRPITGTDGKSYPAKPPTAPQRDKRKPITDTARNLGLDIEKLIRRIEEFGADDRLVRNKNEVAPRLRHHLEQAIKVCQDLETKLTPGE